MTTALDKVPGDLALFIGGLFTVRRKDMLQKHNVTHILSVLRSPLEDRLFEGFQHKVIEVDDTDDENLLEYLPACVNYIQDALDSGGGILVHCAMGKSRSATVVCAYLMKHYDYNPKQALIELRRSRPFCEPNDGFMKQLWVYYEARMADNLEESPAYQRFAYQRELDMSRACKQAPDAEKIRFEDEHMTTSKKNQAEMELRCRKCRRMLATSQYFIQHESLKPGTSCSHFFLDPLSWMRPELEQGKLEGRLECPKCKTNVGKYAWQGMQCNCGEWIVPGISLAKGRLDEAKASATQAGHGIREPPMRGRAGSGQENL